ncbi:S-layer homology domain-containing protein [Cohnella silvisoli]|uniref:S-layer homology domain-containing protein n=1 Tax=Cohnella silvisoli TaxID=2873699 RepID=A0ABV1KTS2_9BACL|nr:S-layer homology domain-containing protein [Cohnella silvisoli]MCD9022660.1 S-layer homology domain-containing protein [Cohnella silvisoli]
MNGEALSSVRGKLKVWLRSGLALALALQLVLGAWAGVVQAADSAGSTAADNGKSEAAAPTREQVGKAVTDLQAILGKADPVSDWVAFGLARSGISAAGRYLPQANKSADDGSLRLVTDFARVALAVNANGGDARKVGTGGKVDLLSKIVNFEKIAAQGANAPAYALIALDAAGYVPGTTDRWTRDDLVKWLVDHRNTDGGWSLAAGKSDVDITAIVLTALAPYKDRKEVTGIIDEALVWLSGVQLETAGFGKPTESSESSVQVLIALTSLGLDPIKDSRFVKNGKSTLARLLEYRQSDGQFSHLASGKADGIATFYALLGLTAVERWMDGLPGLYSGVATASKTSVTVNGLSGVITTGSATGKTALEALINVLNSANIAYGVDRHPQFGALLKSIAGVDNGKFGGYDGWQYAVKRDGAWVTITEGMGSFVLKAGDELTVYYGGGDTTLVHSVKIEPSAPREGQPVTVTVEKESFDWDSGKAVVSAAEGASVTVDGQVAKTDKDGKAQLKSLKVGAYVLSVDGYRTDAAPAYVAWKTKLDVASYSKKVTVRVEGDAGVVASGSAQGGTALEALEQLLKASEVKNEIKDSAYGKYIGSIAGIAAGKYGGYDGWMFAVVRGGAWIIPAEGVGTFLLEDGDEVVVYYSGDATKLADPISVSPAQPKPGQDVTVTVTNRLWDWKNNQFEAAKPVAGVKVSMGEVEAVTNDKGQATLKGSPEGLYQLQVTGYVKDGAPALVRSVSTLQIAGSYSDQSAISAWALDSVTTSRAATILRGSGDGLSVFKPKQGVSRAEFVSALARALGLKGSASSAFADIPSNAWYAKDVGAAVSAGLVGGVSAGKFAPDAALTREQAAILLTRALKLKATATTVVADAKQVSPSAAASVQAVLQQGWMTAYESKFAPKASLSREQAAVIAVRVFAASK